MGSAPLRRHEGATSPRQSREEEVEGGSELSPMAEHEDDMPHNRLGSREAEHLSQRAQLHDPLPGSAGFRLILSPPSEAGVFLGPPPPPPPLPVGEGAPERGTRAGEGDR